MPLPASTQLVSKAPVLFVVRAKFPVGGVTGIPELKGTPEVSVTVTVQDVGEPVLTEEGAQVMLVEVGRRVAVKLVVALLWTWVVSPG